MSWKPEWELPPEPVGDDEAEVIDFFEGTVEFESIPWGELDEWQREAWRREYRDH